MCGCFAIDWHRPEAPAHHLAANREVLLTLLRSPIHGCVMLPVIALSANNLGPDGALALAPSLPNLTQLQALDLGGEWSIWFWTCTTVDAHTSLTTGTALSISRQFLGQTGFPSCCQCLCRHQSVFVAISH